MALETELAAARNRIRELEDQIETDPLVNILNRSGFERALKRGLDYVNRYKASAAVILIDLDNFKSINDRYGRVAGDTVLKAVSNTITRHVRSSDIVGRFGGDEFAVLLWQMCNADAQAKALALEEMIADLKIFYSAEILSITASAGIAMLRPLDSPSNVIGLADRSLYHRKLRRSHEPEVNSTIVRVGKMPDQSKGYDPTIDRPFWEVQRWKRMRTSSASS
jgi:diguanylate cyclase (GGDEF)-like protein